MALASASPVFAAINTTTGNQTLSVSPVRTDVTIKTGDSGTVVVKVTNLTNTTTSIQPIENDFIAGDKEDGTPALILNGDQYAPTHSLKRFMVPLQAIVVGPKATQEVAVTIKVPKNAQAGGYFGAIRFAPTTGSGSSVNLGASVASLILLTVPGPTTEQLTLTNFDITQNGGKATNFRTPDNLSLLLRFDNKGNLQEAPFGSVYVTKGKKVVYSYNFNQTAPKDEVLPDSARRWTIPLKNLGKFGKYTVGATFTYGTKGQSIEITKTIWIIPTTYILGAIIAVVLLIVIIGGGILFLRSYKRRILRSSKRRY